MIGHITMRLFFLLSLTAFGASACATTKANAPEFEEQAAQEPAEESAQVVREEVNVSNPAAIVTTERGAVLHITECWPLAEVARPTGPSVEVGVTAPLAQGTHNILGRGASFYSRYNCR